jgi:hypothetical protein
MRRALRRSPPPAAGSRRCSSPKGAHALGCLIGLVFGSAHVNWDYVRVNLWCEISNMYLTDRGVLSVLSVLLWTLFGGVVAGSVVYMTQLLRK